MYRYTRRSSISDTPMNLLNDLKENVRIALKEDVGSGDVTADLIPPEQQAVATLYLRQPAIICGQPWFNEAFRQIDETVSLKWLVEEGSRQPGESIICEIQGNARSILTAERVALNFLQLLSGTATTTQQYAAAIAHTEARVLDTRKTIPGLRLAQKYAVKTGGGQNHRIGLYDQILIKENHIAAAGSIEQAVKTAKEKCPTLKIEVETENLQEFREAFNSDADIIMLDNYSLEQMKEAVAINNGRKLLEASGNVTLERIAKIAETGVDFISSGALTKDLQSIDLSLRFRFA
ncbi:MAG: carboxylating nicotinate-nucleotide diphosphorylase [Thiotrichales bacterium]